MNERQQPRDADGLAYTHIEEAAYEDPRLLAALREYQAAIDAGQKPNRREFLARYSDVAEELADCLDGLDFVRSAAPQLTTGPTKTNRGLTPDVLAPEQPLGDFRIIRQIGRGGMGVVYEAVQLSLGRRVALKVLPLAATLDSRQLQRFKHEAQAAAQLHHGSIVPVFAVGEDRGVHYYAMQFIDGQTLAAYIAALQNRDQPEPIAPPLPTVVPGVTPSTQGPAALTVASRTTAEARAHFRIAAELGVQTAEALEHAHQMGVIHRDVKPANLLLDTHGHLWVTDFGLARFQGDPGLTATGDVVGTLRYMSPEQAAGKPFVDERSDVYSLGATLYELLALTPAFDARNRQEFLHQILELEPLPLRKRNAAIPADLETIVLKAMAKLPEERYATAQALADDLRRFLEDRPIQARRPTLLEKASKWSRRHRALVGAAVAMLAVAVVGLSVLTLVIASAQAKTQTAYNALAAEQQRTNTAYEAERRQHDRAEQNLRQARELLDFFTQVAEEDLAGQPGVQGARLKLLEASLAYYKGFIEQFHDDPRTRDEMQASYLRVANLLNELGARADAVAMLEQARRMQDFPGPSGPPPGPGPSGPGGPGGPGPGNPRSFGGRGPMGFGRGGFHSGMLLGQPSVQQELKLSPEQVQALGDLFARREPLLRDMRHLSDNERETRSAEIQRLDKALIDVLRPEQTRRLQQLIWQQRGTHALADREVADALQLTEEQRDRIRTIQDEAQRNMWRSDWGGPGRPDGMRRSEDFWKNISEKTLVVLTQEQRGRWKALMGEPFKGELRFNFPPMPPGPRQP